MERVAVYCGTRNLYQNMLWAANSLLYHSNVEKIYFLIEDDDIGFELPPEIECINVSGQNYFREDGPNYNTHWSYMILLRAAFSKIFPHLDCVLSLDVDTLINENISEIWHYTKGKQFNNCYIAAVPEPCKCKDNFISINMGVAFLNLKKMREDKMDDTLITALNTKLYDYPEQDCISEFCQEHILTLPVMYNLNNWTIDKKEEFEGHRKISHFAAIPNWQFNPLWNKYKNIPYDCRNKDEEVSLDIIIPAYNNERGLIRTLKSVNWQYPYIQVTVVDDCSTTIDYDKVKALFPNVNYYYLEKNSGPGVARQYGIDHTHNSHIMFVDCGDIIFSKFSLLEVFYTINSNTAPYIYLWTWINGEYNTISGRNNPCTPAWVYKREFLEAYNITYSTTASYSNEDIGFNHTCQIITNDIGIYDKTPYVHFYETPIYKMVLENDSLTHKNHKEFMYKRQIHGLVNNHIHCVEICEKNNITKESIAIDCHSVIMRLYYDLLYVLKHKPEYAQESWDLIRQYYFSVYQKYQDIEENAVFSAYSFYLKDFRKLGGPRLNIRRFIKELAENETIPDRYLTFF